VGGDAGCLAYSIKANSHQPLRLTVALSGGDVCNPLFTPGETLCTHLSQRVVKRPPQAVATSLPDQLRCGRIILLTVASDVDEVTEVVDALWVRMFEGRA